MATTGILSTEKDAFTIDNIVKTHILLNRFPEKNKEQEFAVFTTTTTTTTLPIISRIQDKSIQNYLPYRCAPSQRVNELFLSCYFIKKQTNIFFDKHPARFYIQPRTMNTNQEYSRYRDAQTNYSNQTFYNTSSYTERPTTRHENDYSRYRDSRLSRSKSVSRSQKPVKIHHKCRGLNYDSEAQRFQFSDDKVPWHVDFPEYKPTEYTTAKIQKNPKADSTDPSTIKNYNNIDGKIDRRSFTGHYYVDPETKRPRNPIGRTGMTGRGRLYHWGPNHAGDPVVTRWKRDKNGSIVYRRLNVYERSKPILEFVAIQRRDTKQWALPGGMVDPGEEISETVKREFREEAARGGDVDQSHIDRLFTNGHKLFQSYTDDPRNTDNAWMETVAMHFHDETGELTKCVHLNAGDDAEHVVWCSVDRTLDLYANHKDFLKVAVNRLDAFW